MNIIITESQLKQFILENLSDEGWLRDFETNKIYWLKDNDKYITRRRPRWIKLNYTPKYWGKKQPIQSYPSLSDVKNPKLGQKVYIKGNGRNSNNYFEFTDKIPGEIDSYNADTKILDNSNGKNKWNVKVITLPKTNINSYHFIGLPSFDLTKSMKHGYIERNKGKDKIDVSFDKKSIYEFIKYMRTYVWHFLKSYNGTGLLPIDIIMTPESSGKLNNILVKEIHKMIPNAKIINNAFEKNISGMYLNQDTLRNKGDEYIKNTYVKDKTLTPQQEVLITSTLEKAIAEINNNFEKERAKGLAKEILKQIKIAGQNLKSLGRGNHKKAKELYQQTVEDVESKIDDLLRPYYSSRNFSPFYSDNKLKDYDSVKGVQIKNLHQIARMALENFFKLSNNNDKTITYYDKNHNLVSKIIKLSDQLQNKRILIIDDNFSTGATLDNICELLLKIGVNKNDIIPMTLGVVNKAYAAGGIDPFNPQGL